MLRHVLLFICLYQQINGQKQCYTEKKTETKETGRTFFNKPVYRDFITYTNVICNDVNLTKGVLLPTDKNAGNAKKLKFKENIKTFPFGVLNNLSQLEELYLSNTHLETIQSGAFSRLRNLRNLYLENNNLSSLDSGTFVGLVSLMYLDLSNNSLNKIDENIFKGLVLLNHLNISNNNINNINSNAFSSLTELVTIDISKNNVTKLETFFTNQYNLSEVFLNNNSIKYLPTNLFDNIANLKHVDLSNNLISSYPKFGGSIRQIKLAYNNLRNIPPKTFEESEDLEELYLNNNNIEMLTDDAFIGLKSLSFLNLQNNRIRSIAIGTFRELTSLVILRLSSNYLTHLDYGLFSGLSNLKSLDLSYNRITYLQINYLFPLQSLQFMNIDGNFISTFDVKKLVENFKNISQISMDNNRWTCDWLANCMNLLRSYNVTVSQSFSYKTSNVNGVKCSNNIPKPTNKVMTTTTLTTSTTSTPTTSTVTTLDTSVTTLPNTTLINDIYMDKRKYVEQFEIQQRRTFSEEEVLQKIQENTKDVYLLGNIYSVTILLTALVMALIIFQVLVFTYKYLGKKNLKNTNTTSNVVAKPYSIYVVPKK